MTLPHGTQTPRLRSEPFPIRRIRLPAGDNGSRPEPMAGPHWSLVDQGAAHRSLHAGTNRQ